MTRPATYAVAAFIVIACGASKRVTQPIAAHTTPAKRLTESQTIAEASDGAPVADTSPGLVDVEFRVLPPRAELYIDGNPQPVGHWEGSIRETRLSRGPHKISLVDLGPNPYPPLHDYAITVPSKEGIILLDLATLFGTLRVATSVPYVLKVDGRVENEVRPGEFKLRPGSHRLAFEASCDAPVDAQSQIDIDDKQTVGITVNWKHSPPEVCTIEPEKARGGQSLVLTYPTVELDGKTIASRTRDGGTDYLIPCGTKEIRVSKQGYTSESLVVRLGSAVSPDYARFCGAGKKWKPLLYEVQLSTLHVDCHEVTVKQYSEFLAQAGHGDSSLLPRTGANTLTFRKEGREDRADYPLNGVTFDAAEKFCRWRAKEQGLVPDKGRVATENDLRVAGGFRDGNHPYPWGKTPEPDCDHVVMALGRDQFGCTTSPSGTVKPVCQVAGRGPYGHCDILGNVAEYVARGKAFGGSYKHVKQSGQFALGAAPLRVDPHSASDYIGFRCAWELPDDKLCNCLDNENHSTH